MKKLATLGVTLVLLELVTAASGARYNASFDPIEKLQRFDVFKAKVRSIYDSHLRAASQTVLGLNDFIDLSDEGAVGQASQMVSLLRSCYA
uniref:Cathepsin propeptide inhibitor domain-containing protein n=1 Tax=Leersia perrieri TaxID=77586 RepID=A0A0D9W8L3_9ORYZ